MSIAVPENDERKSARLTLPPLTRECTLKLAHAKSLASTGTSRTKTSTRRKDHTFRILNGRIEYVLQLPVTTSIYNSAKCSPTRSNYQNFLQYVAPRLSLTGEVFKTIRTKRSRFQKRTTDPASRVKSTAPLPTVILLKRTQSSS